MSKASERVASMPWGTAETYQFGRIILIADDRAPLAVLDGDPGTQTLTYVYRTTAYADPRLSYTNGTGRKVFYPIIFAGLGAGHYTVATELMYDTDKLEMNSKALTTYTSICGFNRPEADEPVSGNRGDDTKVSQGMAVAFLYAFN